MILRFFDGSNLCTTFQISLGVFPLTALFLELKDTNHKTFKINAIFTAYSSCFLEWKQILDQILLSVVPHVILYT